MPSETDSSAQERRELPESMVRAELEKILESEVFSRSQQLRRFLAFIVEQRLTGQGQSLKESVLAHELYGKGTDFDGGTDPIVRVDARRLRDKLREYYEGRSDPVIIALPKGSYVPVFESNSTSPAEADRAAALAGLPERQPFCHRRPAAFLAGGLALTVTVTAVIAWRARHESTYAPAQFLPLASYPGV